MSWTWLKAFENAPSAARGIRTSRVNARKTSALWDACPDSVRSMWPISCAMRPSRTPDSTARTDTNNVCEESFDFVAPMIAIETISAATGHDTRRPFSAYRPATSSKAAFTLRVPPRPERSTTAVSTERATRGIRKNLCGCSDMCPKSSDRSRHGRDRRHRTTRDFGQKPENDQGGVPHTNHALRTDTRNCPTAALSDRGSGDLVLDPRLRQEVDEFAQQIRAHEDDRLTEIANTRLLDESRIPVLPPVGTSRVAIHESL